MVNLLANDQGAIVANSSVTSLTFGDLFAGAGGLSVGFHNAGFESVFFNEIDETAGATHKFNFPTSVAFVRPIQDLTAKLIRAETNLGMNDLDVMVGGPPCQGFSINAPVRSQKDPRNSLFHNYVRLVLEGIKPKFILMENVPGLISLDGGQTLKGVIRAFEDAGYKIIFKILNAAHYGAPQERWRLFILGTRLKGVELSFPQPTHYSLGRTNFTGGREYTFRHAVGVPEQDTLFGKSTLKHPTTIWEAMSDLPGIPSGGGYQETQYSLQPQTPFQKNIRKGAKKLFNHECASIAEVNLERLKHVKPGGSWRDIPHHMLPAGLQKARRSDHTKRYGRLDPNGLSGTVLTKCDPHWGTFFHPKQNRIISVREAARIQTFPDWFKFTGSMTEQYRDVGNAVPPMLAAAVANHVVQMINQQKIVTRKATPRRKTLEKSPDASL
jgi:DNA (cytosine-5)-methyltransferase 1